jgi:hypothetical protein
MALSNSVNNAMIATRSPATDAPALANMKFLPTVAMEG